MKYLAIAAVSAASLTATPSHSDDIGDMLTKYHNLIGAEAILEGKLDALLGGWIPTISELATKHFKCGANGSFSTYSDLFDTAFESVWAVVGDMRDPAIEVFRQLFFEKVTAGVRCSTNDRTQEMFASELSVYAESMAPFVRDLGNMQKYRALTLELINAEITNELQ